MQIAEHKTEAICRRYAITSEADIAEGLAKIAKLRESLPATGTETGKIRSIR